jgi:hypothetical protein
MKNFKVVWEVSKHCIVKAKNKDEALYLAMNTDVEVEEDEITTPAEAFEL